MQLPSGIETKTRLSSKNWKTVQSKQIICSYLTENNIETFRRNAYDRII